MLLTQELKALGIENTGLIAKHFTTPQLCEEIIKNREGRLAHMGALVVRTDHFAERSAKDAVFVNRPELDGHQWVAGSVRTIAADQFDALFTRVKTYLHNRDLYVQDCFAGAGDACVTIRFITEMAWHSLFVRTLYRPASEVSHGSRPTKEGIPLSPQITIVHVPRFQAIPELDGTSSSSIVAFDPGPQRLILIGGTAYGGELRQAVVTAYRFIDSEAQRAADDELVLPLRCAVTVGSEGDVAAFLGRTGNGKTALAADPERRFVGDHEHRWSSQGLTAVERGCYARVLGLNAEQHPAIYLSTRRFGTILENVTLDHISRRVDFADQQLTSNTRAVFPLSHFPSSESSGQCGHPKNIFLLTRDNLGVLPPIARLTPDQAVFAFLTSYVSSLAETEAHPGDIRPSVQTGHGAGPSVASVSPEDYAKGFLTKITNHKVRCWLMNTGPIGEPQGRGKRIRLDVSRALIKAALSGVLDSVEYEEDPLFQFAVPKTCPGIPSELLDPRLCATDQGDYEMRANCLALDFIKGFERFEVDMPQSVREMVANIPILDVDLDVMEQIGFSL